MTTYGIAALILLIFAPVQQDSSIKIHLVAPRTAGTFVDSESKRRSDSLEDLRKRIIRDESLSMTTSATHAHVVLSIVSSVWEETAESKTAMRETPEKLGEEFRTQSTKKTATVTVLLVAGQYRREFTGKHSTAWSLAAGDAATQIRKWIKDNRQELLARRKGIHDRGTQ